MFPESTELGTYDKRPGRGGDAWAEDQLASSPGRAPEQYAGIHQGLAGASSLPLPKGTTPPRPALP